MPDVHSVDSLDLDNTASGACKKPFNGTKDARSGSSRKTSAGNRPLDEASPPSTERQGLGLRHKDHYLTPSDPPPMIRRSTADSFYGARPRPLPAASQEPRHSPLPLPLPLRARQQLEDDLDNCSRYSDPETVYRRRRGELEPRRSFRELRPHPDIEPSRHQAASPSPREVHPQPLPPKSRHTNANNYREDYSPARCYVTSSSERHLRIDDGRGSIRETSMSMPTSPRDGRRRSCIDIDNYDRHDRQYRYQDHQAVPVRQQYNDYGYEPRQGAMDYDRSVLVRSPIGEVDRNYSSGGQGRRRLPNVM